MAKMKANFEQARELVGLIEELTKTKD